MAIKVLPNETVKFSPTGEDFNTFNRSCMQDNELWCQLAEPQVITQFEGEITPLTNTNLLVNPDFDTVLTPWTLESGFGHVWTNDNAYLATFPGNTIGVIRQTLAFTDGKVYRFSIQITETNNNAHLRLDVVGGGQYLSGNFFQFVQPGYYEIYFLADSTTGVDIVTVSPNSATGLLGFSYTNLIQLSTPTVAVYDCDGVFAATIDQIQYSGTKFAVSIPWGELGLTAGCYRICLSDVDDLGQDLLLPSIFIIASNGNPIIASQGATNVDTKPSLLDRAATIQPQVRQENRNPIGIKAFG